MALRNGHISSPKKDFIWIPPLGVGILSFVIYYLTAFRTITWWESAYYSLAAGTLGVAPAPGSLLLTLIGWIITRIPSSLSIAFRLNLLAAILASGTVALVSFLAAKAMTGDGFSTWVVLFASILGGLTLAFSATLWGYARQFTPYILTAFFTTLILLALTEWWNRANSKRAYFWVFLIFLLFGLDFSVHRTNSLLLPGAFLWIGLRRWEVFKSVKSWATIIAGLVVGLSFQFLTILLAQRHPFLNVCDPSTLPRFWDYVSLKMQGGGFLLGLFPRKASFFRVQIADYLNSFIANFAVSPDVSSSQYTTLILSVFPFVFGIFGLIGFFISDWRKGLGFLTFFLLASLGAVVYFNVPEHYFRSLDRHYLASFILFGFLVCYGIPTLSSLAKKLPWRFPEVARYCIWLIVASTPLFYFLMFSRWMVTRAFSPWILPETLWPLSPSVRSF
jgi:hypothetical protein